MSEDIKLIGKMGISALIYLQEKIKGDGENIVEIVKNYTDDKVADEQQRAKDVEDELVKSVVIYYALGTSEVTAPSSGWSTQAPPHEAGKYMWQKTVTTKNDGTSSTTITCIQGADGEPGTSITISSNTRKYQKSSSGTEIPSGAWNDNPPLLAAGEYLWTKTTVVFSDDTTVNSYSVGYHGADGEDGTDGEDGVGINSTTVSYGLSDSPSTRPDNWQTTIPTVPDGYYLWVRTIIDYTDTTKTDTVSYTYSRQGVDGENGEDGNDGTSVTVSSIQYQEGTSATTAPTGSWSNNPVSVAEGKYLWTKTTFSDNTIAYGVARQGINGQDGDDGSTPTIGTDKYWYINGVSTGVKAEGTDGDPGTPIVWKGASASAPANPQVDWCYRNTTDGKVYIYNGTAWAIMAQDGEDGNDGTSVTVSSIQYQAGTSATTAPTGSWSNTPVSVPEGQYLWTKTTFSDGSIAYGIAKQGIDGSSPSYSEEEPASPTAHSLWVKTSTGDIYIYENGEWVPLTTEYITGPELDDSIESKVYETFYAYADDSGGSGFSLVETGKQYRGIYTTASGVQSNDYRDYVWELNPIWASQVASNYISEQSGGLKILTPDAKTYAGLTGLALAFYLGGIEQARLGYLFEGETKAAYGVIAQDIFAFGSGAGIKFDNSNQSNARGRFTWEIRDNGHLSLKKY